MAKKRIHIIDLIRGILIFYVVYYHFMYDLNDIVGVPVAYLYSDWFSRVRDIMSGSLIFIAGFSTSLTRSNINRGLKTFGIALLISIITYFIIPSEFIVFGILHFMGTMMLMYGFVEFILKKLVSDKKDVKDYKSGEHLVEKRIVSGILFIICMVLFFACFDIYFGYIKFFGNRFTLPKELYGSFPMFIMGFKGPFSSADYYPVLPWSFLFLAGSAAAKLILSFNLPELFYKKICPPLEFIGRHTLMIYVVHQPLLLVLSYIISLF